MSIDALLELDIAALRRRYEAGSASPVEVLDATLARLHALEPSLNAFITVLEPAARARAAEAERAFRTRSPTGPLAGVPISVKDVFAIAGQPLTGGSRILRDHRPDRDAAVYERLIAAGAVVFAKTNLLEFAYGFPHPDYGQTNNPRDPGRTAGGSSGGSAASVAAGIGYGTVVSDTGGSARLPAAFCGAHGLKPTYGTLDIAGMLALAPSLDTVGLITRSAADSRLVHAALSGQEHRPPTPERWRIGVIEELVAGPITAEVTAGFEAALARLRDAGAVLVPVSLPDVRDVADRAATLMLAEAAHTHERWFPERAGDYAAGTRANLEAGTAVTATEVQAAHDARRAFRRTVDDALAGVHALACPTIGFTAPEREPDFAGGGTDYILRTIPFSATGHPALTIPAPPDGLPVGVELIARHHHEATLHALAAALSS